MIKYHFKKGDGDYRLQWKETVLEDYFEVWGSGWYGLETLVQRGSNKVRAIKSNKRWTDITFSEPVSRIEMPEYGPGRIYF